MANVLGIFAPLGRPLVVDAPLLRDWVTPDVNNLHAARRGSRRGGETGKF
jgi:hypothetical protein